MKTYKFQHSDNANITLTILAANLLEAAMVMEVTVKEVNDWTQINP